MTIISRYRGVSKDAFLCHFISLPVLCFRLRLGISSVSISSISATSKKLFPRSPFLKYSTSGVRKKRRGIIILWTQASHWASVVRMRTPNVFDAAVQTSKTPPIKHEKRNVSFKLLDRLFDGLQILSYTIKPHQTRWPKGKMFGQQTMFDGVWSPNISLVIWTSF